MTVVHGVLDGRAQNTSHYYKVNKIRFLDSSWCNLRQVISSLQTNERLKLFIHVKGKLEQTVFF